MIELIQVLLLAREDADREANSQTSVETALRRGFDECFRRDWNAAQTAS
jgi:hypothetical protein